MVSVLQGQNKQTMAQFEAMGTNRITLSASAWGLDISQELYDYCLSLSEFVEGVTPNGRANARSVKYRTMDTSNEENMYLQMYLGGDQFSICNNFAIAQGRDLSYMDIQTKNPVIVLGSKLKDYLFAYENPIGKKLQIGGAYYTVIGVYEQKDFGGDENWSMDLMGVLPYTLSQQINGNNEINEFTVKAKSSEATLEATTRLNGFLATKIPSDYGHYYVGTDNTWMEQSEKSSKTMSYVGGAIAGISLLVGGIGIMNIMLVTVTERTREIGIRKAIGGSRKSIITQFLIEACTLCFMGGIIGILFGYLGTLIAGKLLMNMVILPTVSISVGAAMFSVAMGVGFGMYPAVKASGLQPVDALRAD